MKITDTKFEYTTIEEYKRIDSDFEINGVKYENNKSFERLIYPETGEGICPPVCDEYYLK